MKTVTFDSTFDGFRLTIAVCPREAFEKKFGTKLEPGVSGQTNFPDDGSLCCLVWLPRFDPKDPYDVSVLVHELLHCSVYRTKTTGMHCDETDEPLAYSCSELAERALSKLM